MEGKVPTGLSPAEGRKFACTVGAAFLLLGALAWYRHHPVLMTGFGATGAGLLIAGLVLPGNLTPVWRLWMGLAHAISRVTTPVFMALVYFLVFTPFGAIKRLAGGNALHRPADSSGYWLKRSPAQGPGSDLERQF